MKVPSVFTIFLSGLCLYLAYQFSLFVDLAVQLKCSEEPCLESFLNRNPNLRMELYTTRSPFASIVDPFDKIRDIDYRKEFKKDYNFTLPWETQHNGTLWLFAMIGEDDLSEEWKSFDYQTTSKMLKFPLSEYAIPGLNDCKLLGVEVRRSQESLDGEKKKLKPVTHLYKNVYITLLTEEFSINQKDIPSELKKHMKINYHNEILPILDTDFFKMRYSDLVEVDENMTTFQLTLHYNPISVGRQRFILLFREGTMNAGFNGLAMDKIKETFETKSIYTMCLALAICHLHIIFAILSFRNDILFWKITKSYVGLSIRATFLRCFGIITIFLYLIDEEASPIALITGSLTVALELWKCKKVLKIEFTLRGIRRRIDEQSYKVAKAEKETQEFDKQSMRYFSCILIPLFLGGAVYNLIYPPYRNWYSWTLASLTNGLHIFGWILIFPQLFINYKMKSVAALPWRPIFYRALTSSLLSALNIILGEGLIPFNAYGFREDIIFIIFLCQRWFYPVPKTLMESSLGTDDETEVDSDPQEVEEEVREKKDN